MLIRSYSADWFSALESPEKREQVLGPERGEEFSYPRNAQDQQDQHNQSVDQRSDNVALQLEDVSLFRQGEVQDGQGRNQVDGLVQALPVLLEAFFPDVEGSYSQRGQQQEGDGAEDDVGLFNDALDDETPGQAVIQVEEDQIRGWWRT